MEHLEQLENRSVHIFREAYANFRTWACSGPSGRTDRKELRDHFPDDIAKTSALIDRSLEHWL